MTDNTRNTKRAATQYSWRVLRATGVTVSIPHDAHGLNTSASCHKRLSGDSRDVSPVEDPGIKWVCFRFEGWCIFVEFFLSTAIKTRKEGKERGGERERGDGGHVGCLHRDVRADVGVQ